MIPHMDNAAAPKSLIQFHSVSFSYGEDGIALRNITLDIDRGAFTCIIGANGSGKSTLAKHLNALLVPSEGTVTVFGRDTRDASNAAQIRMRTGFVFQNPDNQIVASRVSDEVAFGPENLGLSREEIDARVERALTRLGMESFAGRNVDTLSGGQKQRVALAGALAMEPELLVLDEPGAMLDACGRRELLKTLHELNNDGLTVVLVTHFIEDALEASQVIALREGRVTLQGTPREVLVQRDGLRSIGLRAPFAVEVADKLRETGMNVADCLTDDELANAICGGGRDESRPYDANASATDAPSCHPERSAQRGVEGSPAATGDSHEILRLRPSASARDDKTAGSSQGGFISFDHVAFSYDGVQDALRDVSLNISTDEIVGIVGPMGSGKSTLTQLMNALLVPTSGNVIVDGLDSAKRASRKGIRQRVGLAFQYPETQLFANSVFEDVAFGPRNLKLKADEIEQRVRTALDRVGLDFEAFAERSPFRLSGGQQRLVALAGILALEPSFLVFDEPAAGLDPAGVERMHALIEKLHAQGTGIVMVSHDMDEVARLCTRVIVLFEGRVVQDATPNVVFSLDNAERLASWGLELPHAVRFAKKLQDNGIGMSGALEDALTYGRGI